MLWCNSKHPISFIVCKGNRVINFDHVIEVDIDGRGPSHRISRFAAHGRALQTTALTLR